MKRLNIAPDGTATYTVADGKTATLNLHEVFGFDKAHDLAKKAIAFAVGHVLRNATAGKMDNLDEAHKAVIERADALRAGKWTAHKESGEAGESRTSLLAQALAIVMKVEAKDAAEFISNEIRTALEEKGIDVDADSDELTPEQKSERRKLANAVRKSISDDPAVAVQLTSLKASAAAAKAADALKAAEGKTSKFA